MSIATQINEVLRQVEFSEAGNVVSLSQTFPTDAEDLWDACTSGERLARWFEPVEGDLRLHGRYRLTDSGTVGTIERCDRPHHLAITWEHGGDHSRVVMMIEEGPSRSSTLTIQHFGDDNEDWSTYGPGSGGTGWDLSLLGLAIVLGDGSRSGAEEVVQLMGSGQGQQHMTDFADRWREAHIAAGADPVLAGQAAARAADANRRLWAPAL